MGHVEYGPSFQDPDDRWHTKIVYEEDWPGSPVREREVPCKARVGEAQAVYARARATQVPDGDGIEMFSRASVDAGIGPWTVANVTAPAELRLYRADVTELSLLDPQATGGRDIRVPVGLTTP